MHAFENIGSKEGCKVVVGDNEEKEGALLK